MKGWERGKLIAGLEKRETGDYKKRKQSEKMLHDCDEGSNGQVGRKCARPSGR